MATVEDDDDLYTKLYGEEAPRSIKTIPVSRQIAEEEIQLRQDSKDIARQSTTEVKPQPLSTFYESNTDDNRVSTFDDDEDDLEIQLDTLQPPNADEEDDLDIRLDARTEAVPNGRPATPPGISSTHKYVRPKAQPEPTRRPSQLLPSDSGVSAEPPAAAPPGLQPFQRPPAFPTYDPNDLGVLPSQATAKGQRIRLPGQTRVTPEEYKEFLGLGHGDIFHLDIDRGIPVYVGRFFETLQNPHERGVIDAPWYQPSADPADFFNYGLNPRTWKEHCAAVKKYQAEYTMQRQIEVYDTDGRARSSSADLPPELAAAVAQRRATDGASRSNEFQGGAGNGHMSHPGDPGRREGPGQLALPYNRWHASEGSQRRDANPSKTTADGNLPFPRFALEWNSRESNGNFEDPLIGKRRRLDAG